MAAHETIFEVFLSVQFNFAYHLNYQSQDKKGKFEECSDDFAGRSNKAKRLSCFFAIQVVCHHLNVYRCKMNSCLNLIVEKYQTFREFFKFAFGAVYLPSGFNSAPVFVPFLHSKETITVQFYVDSVLGAKHFV